MIPPPHAPQHRLARARNPGPLSCVQQRLRTARAGATRKLKAEKPAEPSQTAWDRVGAQWFSCGLLSTICFLQPHCSHVVAGDLAGFRRPAGRRVGRPARPAPCASRSACSTARPPLAALSPPAIVPAQRVRRSRLIRKAVGCPTEADRTAADVPDLSV